MERHTMHDNKKEHACCSTECRPLRTAQQLCRAARALQDARQQRWQLAQRHGHSQPPPSARGKTGPPTQIKLSPRIPTCTTRLPSPAPWAHRGAGQERTGNAPF